MSQFQRPPTISTPADNAGGTFEVGQIPVGLPSTDPTHSATPERIAALLETQNVWLERIASMLRDERRNRPTLPIKIEDINMPFWHMVGLMVKAAIASIPAWIILIVIGAVIGFSCAATGALAALSGISALTKNASSLPSRSVLPISLPSTPPASVSQPTIPPNPSPIPQILEYSGQGDSVTQKFELSPGLWLFEAKCQCKTNFMGDLLDAQGNSVGSTVNVIGTDPSTRAITIHDQGQYLISVRADGPWTFHIKPSQ